MLTEISDKTATSQRYIFFFLGTKACFLCNINPNVAFRRKLNIDEPFRKSVEYNVSYFIIKTLKKLMIILSKLPF